MDKILEFVAFRLILKAIKLKIQLKSCKAIESFNHYYKSVPSFGYIKVWSDKDNRVYLTGKVCWSSLSLVN